MIVAGVEQVGGGRTGLEGVKDKADIVCGILHGDVYLFYPTVSLAIIDSRV